MENENSVPIPDVTLSSGTGSPVKEFVKNFIKEADSGLREAGYVSCPESEAHTRVDLSATEVRDKKGELSIKTILSLGASKSDSNTQKLTLFAKKINEGDEEYKREKQRAELKKIEAETFKANLTAMR